MSDEELKRRLDRIDGSQSDLSWWIYFTFILVMVIFFRGCK